MIAGRLRTTDGHIISDDWAHRCVWFGLWISLFLYGPSICLNWVIDFFFGTNKSEIQFDGKSIMVYLFAKQSL